MPPPLVSQRPMGDKTPIGTVGNPLTDPKMNRKTSEIRDLMAPPTGFFLYRKVRNGWQVPVQIEIIEGRYVITVDGTVDPFSPTPAEIGDFDITQHHLGKVTLFGERCDETMYRYRLALKDWAINSCPDHPCLHPDKPVDLRLIPVTAI